MKRLIRDPKGSIMLEFAICGVLFIGFVLGMAVMGLWMYNTAQVKQAARIAAFNVSVTGDPAEAGRKAMSHMNKTLVACPVKNVEAYGSRENGYGVAVAQMDPLFPGFRRLIDPGGASIISGRILIRKEAVSARAHRFRPEGRGDYN